MPTGGGAAYSQLTKSPNYLGDAIKDNNEAAAKVRADKLLADEREEVRDDEKEAADKLAKAKRIEDSYGKMKESKDPNTQTGIGSYDKGLSIYSSNLADLIGDNNRAIEEAAASGDRTAMFEAMQKSRDFDHEWDVMETAAVATTAFVLQYETDAATLSEVDSEYTAKADALLNGNYVYQRSEETGRPVIKMELIDPETQEVKYVEQDLEEFNKLNGGYQKFNINEDKDGFAATFAKSQGLDTYIGENGLTNISVTKWKPKNQMALDAELKKIHRNKQKMSHALYQATGRKKKGLPESDERLGDEFDQADYDAVDKYINESIKGRVTESTSVTTDKSDAKSEQEEENKQYHAERVVDVKGVGSGLPGVNPTVGEKYVYKNKNGSTSIKGVDSDEVDALLISVTVLDDGNMWGEFQKVSKTRGDDEGVDVTVDGATVTKTKTKLYKKMLTETEMGLLAQKTNTVNASGHREYLRSRNKTGSNEGILD